MPYTPNNNPYVPGDPYAYDLKYFLEKIRTTESAVNTANTDASNAVNTANSAASVAASAQADATNALNTANAIAGTANQALAVANSAKFSIIPQLGIRAYFAGVDSQHASNELVWIKAPLNVSEGVIPTVGDLDAYVGRYTDDTFVSGLNPCIAKIILIGCPLFSRGTSGTTECSIYNPQINFSKSPLDGNYGEILISGTIITDVDGYNVQFKIPRSNFTSFTFHYQALNL